MGIEVSCFSSGLYLTQKNMCASNACVMGFLDSKPIISTLLSSTTHLSSHEVRLHEDPYIYRWMVGVLQYFTVTRPDISYIVNSVAQYLHAPRKPHKQAVKRLLHYILGTLSYGIHISRCVNPPLVAFPCTDCSILG